MQAIILAAGMGKRLGELTKHNTKCMVTVNGVSLIDRMLTQLSTLDLNRVIIVVGYEGNRLKDFIGSKYDKKLNIQYVNNPIYDKTNNIYSLALAKKFMLEDDTLLLESDLIFDIELLELIITNPYPNLALVAKYESWMDGTMVRLSNENDILNFIPKKSFQYSEKDSYYKTVNIYKFSRAFLTTQYIPFLEAYSKAMGNNEYYEQVLRVLTVLDRLELKALPITHQKWYEIDDIQDLDIAEAMFSENNLKLSKYYKRYGGYWRFPQLIDYCYLVNPYYPSKKMVDEMRSNYDVLLRQYPSGMNINSLLASKYFGINQEYIVVGNGAAELIKSYLENYVEGKIGIIFPTFEEYPNRVINNCIVKYIPENPNFSYTANDIKEYYSDKDINTLLLINPDNPSGNFLKIPDVISLINWAKDYCINVILDESFVDFTEDFYNNSLLNNNCLEEFENLIIVKSISKSYGVPGLRLGVLASSNKILINKMKKNIAIWNINSFAEFYMQIFGKYEKDYIVACERFINERRIFYQELGGIKFLRVIPSQANYFLCEVRDKYTSEELTQLLLQRYNILIKDCATKEAFLSKNYIRIAIRDRDDNLYLLKALKDLE